MDWFHANRSNPNPALYLHFFSKHLDCAEMLLRKPRYDAEPNYRSVKMFIVWSVFVPSISEQLRMLQVHRSSKPNFTKQPFFWTMQHPQTTLAPNHQAGAPFVAHTIPHVHLSCRNFSNIIKQSKVTFFAGRPKSGPNVPKIWGRATGQRFLNKGNRSQAKVEITYAHFFQCFCVPVFAWCSFNHFGCLSGPAFLLIAQVPAYNCLLWNYFSGSFFGAYRNFQNWRHPLSLIPSTAFTLFASFYMDTFLITRPSFPCVSALYLFNLA